MPKPWFCAQNCSYLLHYFNLSLSLEVWIPKKSRHRTSYVTCSVSWCSKFHWSCLNPLCANYWSLLLYYFGAHSSFWDRCERWDYKYVLVIAFIYSSITLNYYSLYRLLWIRNRSSFYCCFCWFLELIFCIRIEGGKF